jgi:hypothetical protein
MACCSTLPVACTTTYWAFSALRQPMCLEPRTAQFDVDRYRLWDNAGAVQAVTYLKSLTSLVPASTVAAPTLDAGRFWSVSRIGPVCSPVASRQLGRSVHGTGPWSLRPSGVVQ